MQKEYFYKLLQIDLLIRDSTHEVYQLFLQPTGEKLAYQAGQYIEVQYPDGSFQPFSIANAPRSDGMLELLIRFPKHHALHQSFLHHLRTRNMTQLMGPFGSCTFEPFLNNPTLLLCGGVGFSQAKAIIEALIQKKHTQSVHLYWGLQNPNAIFLEKLFPTWKHQLSQFQHTWVFSEAQATVKSQEKTGYVHDAVLQDYATLNNYRVLASGPKALAYAAKILFTRGLSEKHLYSDWFYLL